MFSDLQFALGSLFLRILRIDQKLGSKLYNTFLETKANVTEKLFLVLESINDNKDMLSSSE